MPDFDTCEGEHIWSEHVGVIPVEEPTDEESRQRREAAAAADAMHSPRELQRGMYHQRADVRWRVVDRLIARGRGHAGTIPTFIDVLQHDPSADVRGTVASSLYPFIDDARVRAALRESARSDPDQEVREEARYSLGDDD